MQIRFGDTGREKNKKQKRLEWWNRWVHEIWVVKRRKNAQTLLQKAVRQNSLIIDAYNSRKKPKIDDKCTEADDVIHCIHHSDLDMLAVDCRFITSVSQIPNSPFSAESYA